MAGTSRQAGLRVTSSSSVDSPGVGASAGLRHLATGLIAVTIALSSATMLRLHGLPLGIGEGLALGCIALRWLGPELRRPTLHEDSVGGLGAYRILLLAVLATASISTIAAPWLAEPTKAAPAGQALRNLLALWLACAFAEATVTLVIRGRLRGVGLAALTTTVCVHAALLTISVASSAPWARSMWYEDARFAGLAENPNQLGLTLVAATCAAAALAQGSVARPLPGVAVAIGLATVALATRSDATLLALGAFCLLAVVLYAPVWSARARTVFPAAAAMSLVGLLALFALAALPLLAEVVVRIYGEGAQGSDRMHLWSSAFEAGLSSPVVGLGPAAHSRLPGYPGAHEAHSTFLDWWTMTGALGTAVLMLMFAGAAWDMARRGNRLGLCGLSALAVFSAFHLVLRQPAFWFALGMCYAASAFRHRVSD